MKDKIFGAIYEAMDEMKKKEEMISFIDKKCHEKLEEASLERDSIECLYEDCRYEEVISKLNSIIESLEGGYCAILNKIEGVK